MQWIDLQAPAPGRAGFIAFSIAVLLAAVVVAGFDFVPVLDHVNLAFHEAGHPIFRIFGDTAGWLGGTLGQFVFPTLTTVHFLRRGERLQAAACAIWFAENLRYVALYLGDARTQALPLVGGGEHDWAYLLGRWGLLEQDQRIAGVLVFLSWSGWLLAWAWVAAAWYRGRQQQAAQAVLADRERVIALARQRQRERETLKRSGDQD